MQTTRSIYVFDLDGVITDPESSKVDEKSVDTMRQLLVDAHQLAINTGRSFEWVEGNLLDRLVTGLPDETLQNFIIICEKGGEIVRRQGGSWAVESSEFALPPILRERAKEIFERLMDRLPTMFWDGTKRTMATIEKRPPASLAAFHAERQLLIDELQSNVGGAEVVIDPTTIAIDIESPRAGKRAGAELIYKWIQEAGSAVRSCYSIGDSVSDYEMARYFADQGLETTFVYVGEPTEDISHHKDVAFVATSAHYAAGTREFLRCK